MTLEVTPSIFNIHEGSPMSRLGCRRSKPLVAHLRVEPLESREVPAVITVTSLADVPPESQHSGVTLRDAVQAAETDTSVNGSVAGSGADTIVFDPSLTAGGTATVTRNLGYFFLRSDVTIDGGSRVTINGNDGGLFYVLPNVTATLTGLMITRGKSQYGGAVYNDGTLTLDRVNITNNVASYTLFARFSTDTSGSGGGVFNNGTLTIADSTIANNSAARSGGGVSNAGTLTIIRSTIANNSTTGGDIVSVVTGTTRVSGNGGGLDNGGFATIIQSTIANNTVTDSQSSLSTGGGVANRNILNIVQSTIVNNHASLDGGGVSNPGTLTLANTLVVGNNAPTSAESKGTFGDNGGNLVGVPTGFTLGQVVRVDGGGVPLLANNGGLTQTIALAANSPTVDAGLDANARGFTTDQRGFTRIALAHVDVGAVESLAVPYLVPLAVAVGTEVKVTDPTTGAVITTLRPFSEFGGSVSAVVADFTGDGVADYAVGAGPGGGPHIKVYNGATGVEVASFFAFASTFTGGVSLGAEDVTGDGVADLVVGAGAGGGPHVKVFSGPTFAEVRSFYAFDLSFAGGVSVAAGDLDGDGAAEVIVGAGAGGGPHVKAFDGRTSAVVRSFYAYDPAFSGGVNVSAGDLNGDGKAEIITGAGPGGSPHVKAFTAGGVATLSFYAYDPAFSGGVRVAVRDVNRDGVNDIVTGAGPGGGPHVKAFDGRTATGLQSYFASSPDEHGGVFVG